VKLLKLPILLIMSSIIFSGCASKSVDLKGRTVSNYIENFKITNLNAHQRLNLLIQNIEDLKVEMDQTNPRYYLFENFLERTEELFNEISAYDGESMTEAVWVPNDIAIAPKFHRIVAAFEVMTKAEGILELDPLVVGFDKNVNLNLESMEYILGEYKKAIDKFRQEGLASVTKEAYSKIKARETRDLIQYLAARIEGHYESVITNKRSRNRVSKMVGWALDTERLSGKSPERFYTTLKRLKLSYTYKVAMKALENVDFPDSGDIEGSDASFNQVNSVQICADILNKIAHSYLKENR
tara:strand:- start:296401 stop:297291 length:891 start_codon:yes stop_codon:yes gene_type:complete